MSDPATPLRSFRAAHEPRLPLKAIAEQLGISESQLSRIEREGTNSLAQAMKLAEITGFPVESFAARGAGSEEAA